MGSAKITLCAGLLAVVAYVPTAYAQDGGLSVSPSSPAPGSDVGLRMSGCGEKTATAVSAAFVADAELTVADDVLVGESRVRSTLRAGTYDVKVSCGDIDREIPLTVVDRTVTVVNRPGQAAGPASPVAPASPASPATSAAPVAPVPRAAPSAPAPVPRAAPSTPASPVAPVQAGGGGTARLAAAGDAREAGPGTGHAVIGLLLAGVAAVAVVLRGSRRSRRTG
ncbi:hypothetical protein M2271_004465 [Streptomyces sp. LBL]|uniref:hypothetical protein n=1 Tax=Streptomyces sp. LBL TaxID=2940562 RepID=UPI0024740B67|nr:hypothetical protein [Streptomyces sp. LBL]MDH6626648.1 hypothetical protein [Streptomyces sp. LBL]